MKSLKAFFLFGQLYISLNNMNIIICSDTTMQIELPCLLKKEIKIFIYTF